MCYMGPIHYTKGRISMEKVQHFACKLANLDTRYMKNCLGYWSCQHLRKGEFI